MNNIPVPEQYQEIFNEAAMDIVDIAEDIWPVLTELGCDGYAVDGNGFTVQITKTKNGNPPPVAS